MANELHTICTHSFVGICTCLWRDSSLVNHYYYYQKADSYSTGTGTTAYQILIRTVCCKKITQFIPMPRLVVDIGANKFVWFSYVQIRVSHANIYREKLFSHTCNDATHIHDNIALYSRRDAHTQLDMNCNFVHRKDLISLFELCCTIVVISIDLTKLYPAQKALTLLLRRSNRMRWDRLYRACSRTVQWRSKTRAKAPLGQKLAKYTHKQNCKPILIS